MERQSRAREEAEARLAQVGRSCTLGGGGALGGEKRGHGMRLDPARSRQRCVFLDPILSQIPVDLLHVGMRRGLCECDGCVVPAHSLPHILDSTDAMPHQNVCTLCVISQFCIPLHLLKIYVLMHISGGGSDEAAGASGSCSKVSLLHTVVPTTP